MVIIIILGNIWEGNIKPTKWLCVLSKSTACNVITKEICEGTSCFIFLWHPSCLPLHLFVATLLEEELGKKKADSCRQTTQSCLLLFIAWWTGLIVGHSGEADRLKEEIRFSFLFWFPQTSYLRVCWVESRLRLNVQRRDDKVYSYRLSSPLSHAWPTLPQTLCRCHAYLSKLLVC